MNEPAATPDKPDVDPEFRFSLIQHGPAVLGALLVPLLLGWLGIWLLHADDVSHAVIAEYKVHWLDYSPVRGDVVDHLAIPQGNSTAAYVVVAYEEGGKMRTSRFRVAGNRVQHKPARSRRLAQGNYPDGSQPWVYVSASGNTPYLHDEIGKSGFKLAMCLMLIAPLCAVLLFALILLYPLLIYIALFFSRLSDDLHTDLPVTPVEEKRRNRFETLVRLVACLLVFFTMNVAAIAGFLPIIILALLLLLGMPGIFFEDSMPTHWTNRLETWSILLLLAAGVSWYLGRRAMKPGIQIEPSVNGQQEESGTSNASSRIEKSP